LAIAAFLLSGLGAPETSGQRGEWLSPDSGDLDAGGRAAGEDAGDQPEGEGHTSYAGVDRWRDHHAQTGCQQPSGATNAVDPDIRSPSGESPGSGEGFSPG
jgi:hypothetical protein